MPVDSLLELHELVATRVASLDASEFSQGQTDARWREAEEPFTEGAEPDFASHLAFCVLLEDAPNEGTDRDTSGESARASVRVAVEFLFQLLDRTDTGKLEDRKLSYRAAALVVQAVGAPWVDGNFEIVNHYRPVGVRSDFLRVRTEFVCGLDITI
jgi:hypothetical protein